MDYNPYRCYMLVKGGCCERGGLCTRLRFHEGPCAVERESSEPDPLDACEEEPPHFAAGDAERDRRKDRT